MIWLPHLTIKLFKSETSLGYICILPVLVWTGVQAVAEVRHACSQGPLQQLLLGHRLQGGPLNKRFCLQLSYYFLMNL